MVMSQILRKGKVAACLCEIHFWERIAPEEELSRNYFELAMLGVKLPHSSPTEGLNGPPDLFVPTLANCGQMWATIEKKA